MEQTQLVSTLVFGLWLLSNGDKKDTAIKMTNMNSKSNVISMGAGLGGPARYIAATLNCQGRYVLN